MTRLQQKTRAPVKDARACFASLDCLTAAGGHFGQMFTLYPAIKFGNVSEMAGMNVIIIKATKIAM